MMRESSSSEEDESWKYAQGPSTSKIQPALIQPKFGAPEDNRPSSPQQQPLHLKLKDSPASIADRKNSSTSALAVPFGRCTPVIRRASGEPRSTSPSPSLLSVSAGLSDTEQEADRRERLLLYVLVMRCIAYPFCANQPTDVAQRQLKVTPAQLLQIRDRFQKFVSGGSGIVADEAFSNAVRSYQEVFLQSERVAALVRSGGCSVRDFRDVFKSDIEMRVRCLPEIDGLSKETVLSSWMAKFDQIFRGDEDPRRAQRMAAACQSELVLSKEELYDLFQAVLNVRKYEHQIMFNACQLDNADEQAAQIRRELDGRLQALDEAMMAMKNMESLYYDEATAAVAQLMSNLEAVPVHKGNSDASDRHPGLPHHHQTPLTLKQKCKRHIRGPAGEPEGGFLNYSRASIQLNFCIEVVVCEVRNLKCVPGNRIVYCTMELDGSEKFQTDQAEASRAMWDTQADFTTSQPLPTIKVKLFAESSRMLSLEDKELGKVVIKPTCTKANGCEWHKMTTSKDCSDDLSIKIIVHMEKPSNLKHCGWLWVAGRHLFKKWKKRYICLIQVSQYNFVMASFHERKSEPQEVMSLNDCTVDYLFETPPELLSSTSTAVHYFFSTVREGDSVTYAAEDETSRQLWVQAIYRATGQAHKPQPPQAAVQTVNATTAAASVVQAPSSSSLTSAMSATRRTVLDDLVYADPRRLDHAALFRRLQCLTLEHRLSDPYCSLGWLSPGQLFVLDEYCARYGVRGFLRHIYYLENLLDAQEARNLTIDPTLMHYSFAFCASHVHGNRQVHIFIRTPDGIGTVLQEERALFDRVKLRLRQLLMRQLTEFRFYFPFGRPEGALKGTLSLLERVLMKDIVTPVDAAEVRKAVQSCLEEAAYVNYCRIADFANIEEMVQSNWPTDRKMECIVHVAEMCIEVLQQNEEHHAEAFAWFSDLLVEHAEIFWSMFAVDMQTVLESQPPDVWDSFPLFQLLNDYLRSDANLRHGKFHKQLQETFAPQLVRYVDLMESSIGQSIHKGFERETWTPNGGGCATSSNLLWKLEALQSFIADLHWPEPVFAEHLDSRLKSMAADMLEAAGRRTATAFDTELKRGSSWVDFLLSVELCVMFNTCVELKSKVFSLCSMSSGETMVRRKGYSELQRFNIDMNSIPTLNYFYFFGKRSPSSFKSSFDFPLVPLQHEYHARTGEFLEGLQSRLVNSIVDHFCGVFEMVLARLARYDEGAMFSTLFSIAKPTDEIGKEYVDFCQANIEQVRRHVYDELLVLSLFEIWYSRQFRLLQDWLVKERASDSLHPYQITCLSFIIKKLHSDFELQGITRDVLETTCFAAVNSRIQAIALKNRKAKKPKGQKAKRPKGQKAKIVCILALREAEILCILAFLETEFFLGWAQLKS
uniref:PH domain-containing protein n=1 Tax=Macrostomum lignano TaxID=282301 RepID=A0A1I8H290_9PLAT